MDYFDPLQQPQGQPLDMQSALAAAQAAPNFQQPPPQAADRERMLMDYLTTQGNLQPKVQEIARQRALAEQLRKTPIPGMRQAGRLNVAANPLEMLGSLAQQGVGAYQGQQADLGQKALDTQSTDAFNKLRGTYGMGSPS